MKILKIVLPIVLLFNIPLVALAQQDHKDEQCTVGKKVDIYFFAGLGALIASYVLNNMSKSTTLHMEERFHFALSLNRTLIDTRSFDANQLADYNSFKATIKYYDAAKMASLLGGLCLLTIATLLTVGHKNCIAQQNKASSEIQPVNL